MDAPHPSARRRRRAAPPASLSALAVALAVALAACSASATPAPTPSPTGSTLPATTATPTPAASPTPAATPSRPPAFPVTLTDDEGTDLTLATEPSRIVSLTPAATETLFALGVGARVVGKVEDFSLYPPEAASIPDMARFGSVDVEQIVAAGADLVIAGGNHFNPPEAIVRLRSLGVPVLVIYAPDLERAFADLLLVGTAVGRSAEAESLAASLRAGFASVDVATAGRARPRVFYELDATNGYFGPAPDYFGTEMIRLAGGEPLTSGTPGVFEIPAETIVAFDPEVILLGDAAYGVTPEQVAARPGWAGIAAVRDGAVRPVDDVIVTRPGPRLAEGLRALALAIHPDLVLAGSP